MNVTREQLDMLRGVHWFTGRDGTVGIVLVNAGVGGYKAYIGALPNLLFARGLLHGAEPTPQNDALYIAQHGARVADLQLCHAFFPHVTDWARS